MSRPNIEVKPAPVSDFKEFAVSAKAGSALSCAPQACGGGPGGACQGSCRGCRGGEYISFQPKEAVRPGK